MNAFVEVLSKARANSDDGAHPCIYTICGYRKYAVGLSVDSPRTSDRHASIVLRADRSRSPYS